MSDLAALRAELAANEDGVKICLQYLTLEPDNVESQQDLETFQAEVAKLTAEIAVVTSQSKETPLDATSHSPFPTDDPPPPPPKFDMSKHSKFHKSSDAAPPPAPPGDDAPHPVFEVKDLVMAKWAEDKQWYQASIISKTGSSTDPVYTVSFKGYGNTETKRKHEVRPMMENSKKRKADANGPSTSAVTPAIPASPKARITSNGGAVIFAEPSVDPSLVQKREPSKVSDGPTRLAPEPKKLKGNKALDKAKSSWNDWQKSGPKKAPIPGMGGGVKKDKDSQFRTPDLPGAKVGFTGSGKGMKKDQARAKWSYREGNEE